MRYCRGYGEGVVGGVIRNAYAAATSRRRFLSPSPVAFSSGTLAGPNSTLDEEDERSSPDPFLFFLLDERDIGVSEAGGVSTAMGEQGSTVLGEEGRGEAELGTGEEKEEGEVEEGMGEVAEGCSVIRGGGLLSSRLSSLPPLLIGLSSNSLFSFLSSFPHSFFIPSRLVGKVGVEGTFVGEMESGLASVSPDPNNERDGEAGGMREDREVVDGMRDAREMLREEDEDEEEEGVLDESSSATSPGCFRRHRLRFSSLSTWSFKNRYLYLGELRMAFTM